MPEHMTRLFEVSLGCGILIVLLLLLTPALSRHFSPEVRYWAWLLIALRLCCFGLELPQTKAPVQLRVPQALADGAYDPWNTAKLDEEEANGPVAHEFASAQDGSYRYHSLSYSDATGNQVMIRDGLWLRSVTVGNTTTYTVHWTAVAWAAYWAVGALLLAAILLRYRRFRNKALRWSLPAGEVDLAIASKWQCRLSSKRPVALYRCSLVHTPMLMGFFRPAILLPEHLPAEALPVTLSHELTHLKRRDLWYKGFLTAACCLHWFNPLVWLMLRQAGRDVELCCDYDLLLNQDEEARRAYGQAILDQMTAAGRAASPLTTGFSGDKKSVFTRFRAIMDTTAKKKGTALVVLAALAALLAGGLVACSPAQTEEGGESVWLESQEDISIDTDSLPLYIDEKDGSLPTLTMRGEEDVLVLQLPQGVTGTVRVDEEQSYDSTFFSTFYELEPDENFRVTLPIARRSGGSYSETAVYTFIWGKREGSSFTFRVVMPISYDKPEHRTLEYEPNSLSFSNLAPGEEVAYPAPVRSDTEDARFTYSLTYGRAAIDLIVGLRADDGTEYTKKITGGNGRGAIENIPAGDYEVFVRNISTATTDPNVTGAMQFYIGSPTS